jgi:hypothetical protein
MDCGAAREQQQNGFSSSIKLNPSSLVTMVVLSLGCTSTFTPTITKQSAQVNVEEPCLYQFWSVIDFFHNLQLIIYSSSFLNWVSIRLSTSKKFGVSIRLSTSKKLGFQLGYQHQKKLGFN